MFIGTLAWLQTVGGAVNMIFTADELEETVQKCSDKLVVLMCGLTWCRPCKGISKPYDRFSNFYQQAVFLKMYGNANNSCKSLLMRLKVRSTPSFIFYRGGRGPG